VKRSGRDEPVEVVIHNHNTRKVSTQGNSLYSYQFMVLLLPNQRTGGQNRFCPGVGEGGRGGRERSRRLNMVQIMYTHVCKCKNDTC
jgi:hypothetical protein